MLCLQADSTSVGDTVTGVAGWWAYYPGIAPVSSGMLGTLATCCMVCIIVCSIVNTPLPSEGVLSMCVCVSANIHSDKQ